MCTASEGDGSVLVSLKFSHIVPKITRTISGKTTWNPRAHCIHQWQTRVLPGKKGIFSHKKEKKGEFVLRKCIRFQKMKLFSGKMESHSPEDPRQKRLFLRLRRILGDPEVLGVLALPAMRMSQKISFMECVPQVGSEQQIRFAKWN